MLTVTTDYISGMDLGMMGIVTGCVVEKRGVGESMSDMLRRIRQQAADKMVAEAEELEADAVVNVRYATSYVSEETVEALAYGTAVKVL